MVCEYDEGDEIHLCDTVDDNDENEEQDDVEKGDRSHLHDPVVDVVSSPSLHLIVCRSSRTGCNKLNMIMVRTRMTRIMRSIIMIRTRMTWIMRS